MRASGTKADLDTGEFPNGDFDQGIGAERIAAHWDLSRERLDEDASRSHELAAAAIDAGSFDGQLAAVRDAPGFTLDEACGAAPHRRRLRSSSPPFARTGVSTRATPPRSPTARRRCC